MIPEEMRAYYVYLERLRRSGATNMYGAAPYLAKEFGLDMDKARDILRRWMNDYNRDDYRNI